MPRKVIAAKIAIEARRRENEAVVAKVKALCLMGESIGSIARRFKRKPATISAMVNGKTYKHVRADMSLVHAGRNS